MTSTIGMSLALIFRDPVLRLVALMFMLLSSALAGIIPYQALIGVGQLGLSEQIYGIVIAIGGIFSVVTAVIAGVITDQRGTGRDVSLISATIVVVGNLAVFITQDAWVYALVHMFMFPIGGTIFVQLFALARVRAMEIAPDQTDALMSILRAAFSLPFAFIPAVWGLVIASGTTELFAVYGAAGLAISLSLVLGWFYWPNPKKSGKAPEKSGLSFSQSISEIAKPYVLTRVTLVSALQAMNTLYMILIGLFIVQQLSGSEQQVGLFTGGVAFLEIPFMLIFAWAVGKWKKSQLILLGGAVFSVFLIGLGLTDNINHIWPLLLPAGIGAAVILSIAVAYLQDLIAHRPGAGSSLIAVANFSGQLIAAAVFAIATIWFDYSGVAIIGGIIAFASGALIWALDRPKAS